LSLPDGSVKPPLISAAIFPTRSLSLPDQAAAMARVRLWLAIMALPVFAMVLVGGTTRLTDSGLSITEWRPFMGAIRRPPGRAPDRDIPAGGAQPHHHRRAGQDETGHRYVIVFDL